MNSIRSQLDHPVVDADGHQLEVLPVVLDFVRDIGGPHIVDRFMEYLIHARRAFRQTQAERNDARTAVPVWWPVPTENTVDRATTVLPGLLYERMEEIGIDFGIVYPGQGLLVITLPGMADDELRRTAARAFNLYNATVFREYADRLTPTAVIPMHTPEEAITELDFAIGELGLKAAVFAGDVLRPVPAVAREHPELAHLALYQDCFGIDSPYDYDPVWAKCLDLGVAPTFHSGPIGRGSHASVSRHQYNQIGGFAEGGEAIAKSLFFGGVTRRFPTLRFGFLEGGVTWGQSLFCRMLEHWEKRNGDAIMHLDPARLDTTQFGELIDRYADPLVLAYRDRLVADSLWSDHPDELDDWSACGLRTERDLHDQFVPHFFYGCEGDDRLAAAAFDTRLNPFGARFNAMLGSDIGHFDVQDMRNVLVEAHELVDEGLMSSNDFRDFTFANAVRLHGGMNPNFFKGTCVEQAAADLLARQTPKQAQQAQAQQVEVRS
ncbi:MAG TPA: amidohydrolase family protein [Acidimicrobiales bacterium]|nr:amidohydrolase family protein [Acidimicrobiales bacterium]